MHILQFVAQLFGKDDRAVTALEYGLIAALIACAIISATTSLGTHLSKQFTDIAAKLTY